MKHIKLFELWSTNDEKATRAIDEMNRLIRSVQACPSTKHLASDAVDATNLFITFGKEKITQVLDELDQLQLKLLNQWDPRDEKYLLTDHNGLKHAPTSQISCVKNILKYEI